MKLRLAPTEEALGWDKAVPSELVPLNYTQITYDPMVAYLQNLGRVCVDANR